MVLYTRKSVTVEHTDAAADVSSSVTAPSCVQPDQVKQISTGSEGALAHQHDTELGAIANALGLNLLSNGTSHLYVIIAYSLTTARCTHTMQSSPIEPPA